MTIRPNTIVIRKDSEGYNGTSFRVEDVGGDTATLRSLDNYLLLEENVDDLEVRYYVDPFEPGDTVRVRPEYVDKYSESEGGNDLTVVTHFTTSRTPTTRVKTHFGEEFTILTERLLLVRPALSFKAGDRVVIDLDRANKFGGDGIAKYWQNAGVLRLTEDSGSRCVQTTSHVQYEDREEGYTNNVPTRWLKLYVEPEKRVVGQTIKAKDIKAGDKIKATFTQSGILCEYTGVVEKTVELYSDISLAAVGGGSFPFESRGAVYTLLEEAPEPVNENLQKLLDAEIGDIAFGTYANEYWKKTGEDEWALLGSDGSWLRTTLTVFGSLYKLKYGELHIYRKVEDAD